MQDAAEILRLITNLIRTGTVFSVDLSSRPALVRIRDGSWESAWLQWAELRAGTTSTWNPPTAGEQVIAFCPGGDTAAGYALAGLHTTANPAPSDKPSEHVTLYPDGARIVYDHEASVLTVSGVKTAKLQVAELTEVDCPLTVFKGKVVVEDLFTYQAGMAGTNSKGNTTSISGNITHTGGALSSNGVVVHTHKHGGVERGGSTTEGPDKS